MKKIIIVIMSLLTCASIYAHPHWGRGHYHRCHGRSWITPAAFVGGLVVGSILNDNRVQNISPQVIYVNQPPVINTVPTQQVILQPTVITQTQQIWIEGKWITQIQPNGTSINVWIPGHYETRVIQVTQ